MKKLLKILLVLVLLLVTAAIALPFLIPAEKFRAIIIEKAEAATGRKVAIEGALSLRVFPSLGLTVGGFSLGNAPGLEPAQMLSLEELVIDVQARPLLNGELQVDSFILKKPVIHLARDKAGHGNWEFPEAGGNAASGGGGATGTGDDGGQVKRVSLGDVRLEDGAITWSDASTGASESLTDIDMQVSLPDLSSPLKARGGVTWKGQHLTLDLTLDNPEAAGAGKPASLTLAMKGDPAEIRFDGQINQPARDALTGGFELKTGSVRGLATWLGNSLPGPEDKLGPASLTGKLTLKDKTFAVTDARLALDDIRADGALRIDASSAVPRLAGKLSTGPLDFTPWAGAARPASSGSGGGGASGGSAAPAGWSEEPIDLTGLKAANADFDLQVESLKVKEVALGKTRLRLELLGGRLTASLAEFNAYEGQGKGTLTLDGSGATPALAGKFDFAGIQAKPLLTALAGFDRLSGTGKLGFDIKSQGRSQKALIGALAGTGNFAFTDGAIRGINLGAILRNPVEAALGRSDSESTDFTELTGSFTIAQGMLSNQDTYMKSPLFRVRGKGQVDLPAQALNYRLEPELAATAEGQGGKDEVASFKVPVVISGPWSALKITPDLGATIQNVLQDPGAAKTQLKDTVKGFKEGLLGGARPAEGDAPAEEGSEPAPAQNPKDMLKGLLGR